MNRAPQINGTGRKLLSGAGWCSLVLLALLVLPAAVSYAQEQEQGLEQEQEQEPKITTLYQWTDRNGVVHITDDHSKIPAKYYSSAIKIERPVKTENKGAQPAPATAPEKVVEPNQSDQAAAEEKARETAWRERMRDAKKRLVALEKAYHDLEKERDEAKQNWGGPTTGRFMAEAAAEQRVRELEEKMVELKKDLDEVRNDVEVAIPDEARRAGVPPGWLRE